MAIPSPQSGGRCGLRGSLWFFLLALVLTAGASPARSEVVINEILYRPGTAVPENTRIEFIELLNTGSTPVPMDGWRFSKGVAFTFPEGTTLGPGAYLIVAADSAAFRGAHPGVSNLIGGWTGQLSNSGEKIELVNAAAQTIDAVEYADEGDWATRGWSSSGGWTWSSAASTGGRSLELRTAALSRNRGQNWGASAAAGGTPGAANSLASTNLAPLIGKVRHAPAVPKSADPVTISCTLEDEEPGSRTGTVFWRTAATTSPGEFASAAMVLGSDGSFTATLPPQPSGTVVEFYVQSSDRVSTRTWPAPAAGGQQSANAFFQFSDSAETGASPHYRLVLSAAELAAYNSILTSSRSADTQVNATLVATDPGAEDGYAIRYGCGVRLRGNSSRSYNPPPLRVEIPADRPWGEIATMNLNTRHPWLQVLGMRLLSASGIVAPDAKGVKVSMNNADRAAGNPLMAGRHAHLEPLDSRFVARHFPKDRGGNLYSKRSASTSTGYSRDLVRWGVANGSLVRYNAPGWWTLENWDKDTNSAAGDWSDLTTFARTMHTASGATYKSQISAVIDVDQWLRWMAVLALLNDYETNLSNGIDDDYAMYRGEDDPRFKLIPHDLDTICGQGDTASPSNGSLFPFITDETGLQGDDRIPQLIPFINHPEIRVRYFAIMRELLNGPFSKAEFDAFVANHIGGWASPTTIMSMITWMNQRRAYALGVVDRSLTVSASATMPVQNGFPRTTASTTTLSGSFDIGDTAAVRVNGVSASVNFATGGWSLGGIALMPGINRITVQALDASGMVLETQIRDVWRDSGATEALPATIAASSTLTAAGGPYTITGNVTVPTGVTLTVEAGTNLWFSKDATLTVRGVLRILGSEFAHVRCCPWPTAADEADPLSASLPAGPPKWIGIRFVDSMSDQNTIQWADILHAQDAKAVNGGSVGVVRSRALLDRLTFAGTYLRMVYAESSSLVVQNSAFPDMFAAGESPLTLGLDNIAEQIKGSGTIPTGGHFIIRGNTFGTNKGHNDVIDVSSGRRPAPIVQILNNVFAGVGDEQLDLDGDAYVAGNFFTGAVKDPESSDAGYSSGISTSDFGTGTTTVVARNVFFDMDHALNLKIGAAAFFENNTVVKIHGDGPGGQGVPNIGSAINLFVNEVGGQRGDGAFVRDNIFFDAPRVFGNADLPSGSRSKLELVSNMLTGALAQTPISAARTQPITTLGTGNFVGEPAFANVAARDFGLLPGTAGKGAGRLGQDLGATVPAGIFITGEPAANTASTGAALRVGGPGIFAYRYRVNGGPWSSDISIGTEAFNRASASVREGTIALSSLPPGTYTVEALGRDFAGNWQTTPTVSKTWTVDPALRRIVLNEVLADNRSALVVEGAFPDYIELHNASGAPVDLAGMSLSDDPAAPAKFIFPAGSAIPAGGFLVVHANSAAGFSLDAKGEGVFLFDTAANGRALIDSITFGLQLADLSVGRVGWDGGWTLTKPTPGAANTAQPLGNPNAIRINEWLAASQVRFGDDFVELHNPGGLPAALGGMRLSDEPWDEPAKFVVRPLSYIAASGFAVFTPTAASSTDASALSFSLSASFEALGLFASNGQRLHLIDFDGERNDISQGLSPDGGTTWADMLVPTPGAANLTAGATYDRMLALLNGLRISEIMYHPAGNAELEFIELVNISSTTLDLTGVRLTNGVDFVFPASTLTAGSRVLVVKNAAAMQAAYGADVNIAGQFAGRLDNSGETIELRLPAPYDAAILSFRYSAAWLPATAGGGFSLEFPSAATLPPNAWSDAAGWRASTMSGGTPALLGVPVITSATTASIIMGDTFSYQIAAANNPAGFGVSGLPPGLIFNAANGVISGAPASHGRFPVTLTASNSVGTGTLTLLLTIAPSGPLTTFAWDAIASPQQAGVPFPATLRAVDAKGRTVIDFPGPVSLGSPASGVPTSIGTGTSIWNYPLSTYYHDARTQVIYLAEEIGAAGKITALALDVSTVPGQTLNKWTIRMRHSSLASYTGAATWEGSASDWTTVYQKTETVTANGWVTFQFSTPFEYNGTSNLMVDFSFNNASYSTEGYCRYTVTSATRSLYYQTDSGHGDPLLWSGSGPPSPSAISRIPNVQLTFEAPALAVSPAVADTFVDGVWSGNLTVTPPATNARLRAADSAGRVALSNSFEIASPAVPMLNNPPVAVAVSGQPFEFRVTATDAPSSFGATGLPAGLSIDAVSGVIRGITAASGTYPVDLSAANATGTGTATLSLEVQSDRDGDGLPDAWEAAHGLDPDRAAAAGTDSDGDGLSDASEFFAGTLPRNAASGLAILGAVPTSTSSRDVAVTWSAVAGRRYRVLSRTDLATGIWHDLTPMPITAGSATATFLHVNGLAGGRRFYRVEVVR